MYYSNRGSASRKVNASIRLRFSAKTEAKRLCFVILTLVMAIVVSKATPPTIAKRIEAFLAKFKRPLSIGLIICLLLVGLFYYFQHSSNTASRPKCSDALLHKASGSLDASKVQKLKPVVAEVQSIKGYDSDPDCLNIVVTYYINLGDPQNAGVYLTKLQQVYNPKVGFNPKLGTTVINIQMLKDKVAFLQKAQDELRKNSEKISAHGSKRQ